MPKDNKSDIAQNLITLRKKLGYTQQKVADILGIQRPTYAKYECSVNPPIETLLKLAEIFNVSMDEISQKSSSYMEIYRRQAPKTPNVTFASDQTDYTPEYLKNIYKDDIIELTENEKKLVRWFRSLSSEEKSAQLSKINNHDYRPCR